MAENNLIPLRGRGSDLETFTRKVFIVAAVALLFIALWNVRRILIILAIAAGLAAGIAPAVRRVQVLIRHHTRRKVARGTAVLLVYLPFVIVAAAFLTFTIPHLMSQSHQLSTDLPRMLNDRFVEPASKFIPPEQLKSFVNAIKERMQVGTYIRGFFTTISALVAILFLIVYMLIDAERLKNLFLLLFPASERTSKRNLIRRVSRRMSSWLSGQLLLAGIIGGTTLVALLAFRIPYAVPLALIAAVGEMIPLLGPIIGAIPALMVAAFLSPWQFWAVLIFAIAIQQIENYLIVPRVMGKKVQISPLAVFVAFMCGATLLGIIGAIMAIPAAAILQVIFEESFVMRRERRQNSDRPGTLAKSES